MAGKPDDGWYATVSPERQPAQVIARLTTASAAALLVSAYTDRSKSDGWYSTTKPEKTRRDT